jgi:hypothetical protein
MKARPLGTTLCQHRDFLRLREGDSVVRLGFNRFSLFVYGFGLVSAREPERLHRGVLHVSPFSVASADACDQPQLRGCSCHFAWERFGKEVCSYNFKLSRTESTGRLFIVRSHNPKVVGSNPTPATNYLRMLKRLPIFESEAFLFDLQLSWQNSPFFSIATPASFAASSFSIHSECVRTSSVNEPVNA